MLQSAASLYLFRSGSLQLAASFLWGTMIPTTPYPRIGLSLHLNMIQHGLLSIAAASILSQKGLVELSSWQANFIAVSHLYLWVLEIVMLCNCWWGTDKLLQIVYTPATLRKINLCVVGEGVGCDGWEDLARSRCEVVWFRRCDLDCCMGNHLLRALSNKYTGSANQGL